jgi:hypothetical protein
MESASFPHHGDVESGVMDPGILMLSLSGGIQAPAVLPQLLVFI